VAAELESRHQLCTFHTDRREEFTSNELSKFFSEHGVQRHLMAPYAPQQNGSSSATTNPSLAWLVAC
jgi:transposase InsO family protein